MPRIPRSISSRGRPAKLPKGPCTAPRQRERAFTADASGRPPPSCLLTAASGQARPTRRMTSMPETPSATTTTAASWFPDMRRLQPQHLQLSLPQQQTRYCPVYSVHRPARSEDQHIVHEASSRGHSPGTQRFGLLCPQKMWLANGSAKALDHDSPTHGGKPADLVPPRAPRRTALPCPALQVQELRAHRLVETDWHRTKDEHRQSSPRHFLPPSGRPR